MAGLLKPKHCLVLALFLLGGSLSAQVDELPRHPLEIKALTQPDEALAEIPAAVAVAQQNRDVRTLALLYLAQANACRVVANWPCQRNAGNSAREAAVLAKDPVLEVRGLIADGRGSIAMQDFLRGERLLGEAELLLAKAPVPALIADVFLAYSSLSYSLNRFETSASYAQRGIDALPQGSALPTHIRLLRNLGRAQTRMQQTELAAQSLRQAQAFAVQINDPKLRAELYLESARLAHSVKDVATQTQSGLAVLRLADELKNSQLKGQAHEALGVAAIDRGDLRNAERELRLAHSSFNGLKLDRDELRVLRALIKLITDRKSVPPDFAATSRRQVDLSLTIEREDRAKAAADFEARLRFLTTESELKQLRLEAEAAKEREQLLLRNTRLAQLAALLVAITLAVVMCFLVQLRRNKRLQEKLARIDPLTGIANRRQWDERLSFALTRSKRHQLPLMVLVFDVDKFKSVNDTYGHSVGDAVILEFARRIGHCIRESDLHARLGGDEFVVLVEDATGLDEGLTIANKIIKSMEEPMNIGSLSLAVTTSIGIGFMKHPTSAEDILELADRALYAAKEAGRNTARGLEN